MRQQILAPLEKTLQQLITDLESDPSFNPAKIADVKRASDAIRQMVQEGSGTNDAIHALVFTVARMVIMSTPVKEEVTRRENYTRMMFDYMTGAMSTPVCHECGYPHEADLECEMVELDLGETDPVAYEPQSHYQH